jgi:hypothetical protein
MKRLVLRASSALALLVLAIAASVAWAQAPIVTDDGAAARIAWWRDAKFGLFIHWGLYAIPGRGEWVQWNEQIPVDEYAKLASQFTADKFDADAWAATAKAAGMKYTVMVTRHHDGFAMFDDPGSDFLILRTSWVYGTRGSNFLLTMLRLARERTELRIVDDQIGAPTSSECIAQATAGILAQLLAPAGDGLDGRSGIYNLTSTGETSWCGFAKALLSQSAATYGFSVPNLIPISTSDYPRPAKRPANSRLSCQRLAQTFGISMPSWEDALSLVLETLAEGVSPDKPR